MRKGEQARRALISSATALFDERGYDSVSMRDIAQALKWPKSLIYYYCTGKTQLALLAARECADALLAAARARVEACPPDAHARLEAALACAGFWRGDAQEAARELCTRYSPDNLAWRGWLRTQLVPDLGALCDGIVRKGVRDYEMYTPCPDGMGRVAVELTGALADALAQALCAHASQAEALERAEALLRTYRCALGRLVDAPFGALRLVELDFVRDVHRAYMEVKSP